jgi:prevent-host-death family protein
MRGGARPGRLCGLPEQARLGGPVKIIGAFEAKNKLSHLLDLVEQGEEITITRHGKDVTRIVPARSRPGREQAHAAIHRIRRRAEALKLGSFAWVEWKTYRDEGRP